MAELKKIKTILEYLQEETHVVETDIKVEALPEDIKAILDKDYLDKKDIIEVKRHKELDQNQIGYSISFPEGNCAELDKTQLQTLINHPNFKGLNISLIHFKYDYDLQEE